MAEKQSYLKKKFAAVKNAVAFAPRAALAADLAARDACNSISELCASWCMMFMASLIESALPIYTSSLSFLNILGLI